jgi:hypothetical protein
MTHISIREATRQQTKKSKIIKKTTHDTREEFLAAFLSIYFLFMIFST